MEKFEMQKDILVMYVSAASFPDGIEAAFKKLETSLPAKDGRNFFGISWADKNGKIVYKAAAGEKFPGEGKSLGLETFVIKKGTYISKLITDFMKNKQEIGATFKQMLKHPELDTNSYCLEWYKGGEVLCMVKLESVKDKRPEKSIK